MCTTIVRGHSDDLIEINGHIVEEFTYQDEKNGDLLAFSDGTLLRIRYADSGVWRIELVRKGSATVTVIPAPEGDESNYSDQAELGDGITWVALALAYAAALGDPVAG